MSLEIGKISKGICVLHTPKASYTSDGNSVHIYETNHIGDKKINVLGAGDVFCASFISKSIENEKNTLKDKIKYAHDNTTKYLTKGR